MRSSLYGVATAGAMLCVATGCRQILGFDDPQRNPPDPVDSGSNFQCADDSTFGQNDAIDGAFQTPVATQVELIVFAGLAICPAGDKDHYKIEIPSAGQNLEVIVQWESGAPVNVAILNAGGTAIANAIPVGATMLRVCVASLPVGTFYASAFAGATVENNYRLSIAIVPSC